MRVIGKMINGMGKAVKFLGTVVCMRVSMLATKCRDRENIHGLEVKLMTVNGLIM